MSDNDSPGIQAWGLILVLSLIWGSSFILIKRGLEIYTPLELAGLRVVSASVALLPFAVRNLRYIRPGKWPFLLISGFVGSFFPAILFALAQTRLSSSITGVMNATTPIFVMIIGFIFFNTRSSLRSIIGIGIGLMGTIILAFANGNSFGPINYYIFLVMLATIFYATNLNLIKAKLSDVPSLAITSLSLCFAGPVAVLLLTGTSFFEKTMDWEQSWFPFTAVVLLGVIGTGFALILFNKLVKLTSPVFTSLVTYFIPIIAIVWGLFDGESLSALQLAGMFVILVGVYLTNRKKRTSKALQRQPQ